MNTSPESPQQPLSPNRVSTERNPPEGGAPSPPFVPNRVSRRRKAPIHLPLLEFHNRSPIVFVTVCSAHRHPLFARPEIHSLLIEGWRAANLWQVGHYTVMPDHIHFFCAPASLEAPPLTEWIKFWKTHVSRHWPHPEENPIWQPDFWDRQLRTSDSYGDKWDYMRHNPVRHGLVVNPKDWPYQGELNFLEWHDP